MSTAPRVSGVPNGLIYAFIGGLVLILLLCGGAAFYLLLFRGGSGVVAVNTGAKSVDPRDALQSAELFAKDMSREDYEHVLKYRSAAAFRRRYPSPEDLKGYVEGEGKGLIGALQYNFKSIDTTPKSVKLIGQVGGGPNGASRFELLMVDEGDGVRVAELVFKN